MEVVSQNYFAALEVKPLLGRAFVAAARADGRGESVRGGELPSLAKVLRRQIPALPGKTTLLDGKEFTVIGIAPQNFCGLRQGWSPRHLGHQGRLGSDGSGRGAR